MKIEESIAELDFPVDAVMCDGCGERPVMWRMIWHDCNVELACGLCYAVTWQALTNSCGGQWTCTRCQKFFPTPVEFMRGEVL